MRPNLKEIFSFHANDNSPAAEVSRIIKLHPDSVEAFGSVETINRILQSIKERDEVFEKTGGAWFGLGASPERTAEAFTRIHINQYRNEARPSLPALAAHHLKEFGLTPDNPHFRAAMLVAARAEIAEGVEPEYHNRNHYEDVTAQTAEFLKHNNQLAIAGASGARMLTPEEMADSLTAALGHDLDHPGGKNAMPGEAKATDIYRLERKSFAAIEPLLQQAGLAPREIEDIHTMILTTSPDGPHGILKAVAKAQQEGQTLLWADVDPDNKFPELQVLAADPKLTQRAAMLEDADLGASAFEGLASNVAMSENFTGELQSRGYKFLSGPKAGQPEDLRGVFSRAAFGKFVVGEGPASVAAQDAVGANYKAMREAAEREIAAINTKQQPPTPAP
jgi:hypothetical protein